MNRKYFNTEGSCNPKEHYMVCLDERLARIKNEYVDRGSYFVINCGRQYGKTTTLQALEESLKQDYTVIAMDFQEFGNSEFKDEEAFVQAFSKVAIMMLEDLATENSRELAEILQTFIKENPAASLWELFGQISELCKKSENPIVLLIDEVDSASNNQVFLDFLSVMRGYYLNRNKKPTFHSVILAGVYDIKNLKLKLRTEDEHQYNSPWNIATEFKIPMSFSEKQITEMLVEYEKDYHTGMDVEKLAESVFGYTSGYPYLVSALCKLMDEDLFDTGEFKSKESVWTQRGLEKAVRILLNKKTTLFDSLAKQMDEYDDLRTVIEEIIYQGKQITFNPYVRSISLGIMFGFLKEENGHVSIANRIFEMLLLSIFITQEATQNEAFRIGDRDKNQFIENGHLNMDLVLAKFVEHYHDIYGENDERFIENFGRKFFLFYLKPIINGTGNYYIEAQTLDARRTDVVVDYCGEQFVIELKIWHGNEYHERGEKQLAEYLDYFHQKKGYLLSFNFNKKKQIGIKEIKVGDKTIIEAVV